jgi:DNA-binding CsgD family transcriptional regulator/tetratricopeptide (TPR) repeat protein
MTVLVGRDRELQLIADLVAVDPRHPRGLVLVGDAGSGKSSLLVEADRLAAESGRTVVLINGHRDSLIQQLALLLQPYLPALGRDDAAVIAGFGPAGGGADSGAAVLALLEAAASDGPLLLAVDDADRADAASLEVLSFVFQRCRPERMTLLLAVGGPLAPAGFDRTFPERYLEPLDDGDAHRVVEQQPGGLDEGQRAQVVHQAAGNPLALVELTHALTRDPAAVKRWPGEPLPIGARLSRRIMARVELLPAETRFALLVAAVEGSVDGSASITGGVFAGDLTVFEPAELSRIVSVDRTGVRFAHPLVRSAIYYDATFARRAEAHRWIADAMTTRPDLRAWHLAAEAFGTEESLAALLEASVPEALRRGGGPAAGRALERAAELSAGDRTRARRYLVAARYVAPAGNASWVEHLAQRALEAAAHAGSTVPEQIAGAWVMGVRGRFTAAATALTDAVEGLAQARSASAWDVVGVIAAVGYQSGSQEVRTEVAAAAARLDAAGWADEATSRTAARRILIDAYLSPGRNRAPLLERLAALARDRSTDAASLIRLAGAAWMLDETETAVSLAQAAVAEFDAEHVDGVLALLHSVLDWSLYDAGYWDQALESAQITDRLSRTHHRKVLTTSAEAALATIAASRGDLATAQQLARSALAATPPNQSRAVEARAHLALGVAASAAGEHLAALWHLRHLFDEDGAPLHWHVSYLGLAELAAAAARSGEAEEARARLRKIETFLPPDPSPRIALILAHGRALLAVPADAEAHFRAATSGIEGRRWPFDYARAKLDHGSWLRRQRRVGEAGPLLESARERFRDLGATPWRLRAEAELRASSVTVPGIATSPSSLTAQQWEIVRLAAGGLTNREIADRLFLSPRTVGSHLYRSFPKLGVTHRGQLRTALAAIPQPDAAEPPASDRE